MLIKCPECQKEVSDQAKVCIHCGFPLKKPAQPQKIITETPLVKKVQAQRCPKCKAIYPASNSICPNCGNGDDRSMEEKHCNAPSTSQRPRITCPTCQSDNVVQISTTSKVVSVVAFGLFSNKRSKTFKCKRCGYMW